MNNIIGADNNWLDYALVLLIYGLMYLLIRYPKPKLELNYKANYFFLVGLSGLPDVYRQLSFLPPWRYEFFTLG
jgi:hypothetical protein